MSGLEFAVAALTVIAVYLPFALPSREFVKGSFGGIDNMTIDTDSVLHTHISDGMGYSTKTTDVLS